MSELLLGILIGAGIGAGATLAASVVGSLLGPFLIRRSDAKAQRDQHRRRAHSGMQALAFYVLIARQMLYHQDRQQQFSLECREFFRECLVNADEAGCDTIGLRTVAPYLADWVGHAHHLGHQTPRGETARKELPRVLSHLLAAATDAVQVFGD